MILDIVEIDRFLRLVWAFLPNGDVVCFRTSKSFISFLRKYGVSTSHYYNFKKVRCLDNEK